MRRPAFLLLLCAANAFADRGLQCEKTTALLASPERALASANSRSAEPVGQLKGLQDLRGLMPEMGRSPTAIEGVVHGQSLLEGKAVGIEDGRIRAKSLSTWRAGEMFAAAREAGGVLSAAQTEIADAYLATRDGFLTSPAGIPLAGLTPEQKSSLQRVLHLMGVEAVESRGSLQTIRVPADQDVTAVSRAMYLMKEWNPESDFETSMDRLVMGATDILSSRATASEMTAAPEIYTRWESHLSRGNHSTHGTQTRIFTDPNGRMSILSIGEKTFPGVPNARTIPAEVHGLQIVPLVDNEQKAITALRVSRRKGEEEHSNGSKCISCHRVRGGQIFTLVAAKRLPPSFAFSDREVLPGVNEKSRFISSSGLRRSGMAVLLSAGRSEMIQD